MQYLKWGGLEGLRALYCMCFSDPISLRNRMIMESAVYPPQIDSAARRGWFPSLPSPGSSDSQSGVFLSVSAAYRPMIETAYAVRHIRQAARPP